MTVAAERCCRIHEAASYAYLAWLRSGIVAARGWADRSVAVLDADFYEAVTARGVLARVGAGVRVARIAVIAVFPNIGDSVPAPGQSAIVFACVPVAVVAVIALLARVDDPIPTVFEPAGGRTSVTRWVTLLGQRGSRDNKLAVYDIIAAARAGAVTVAVGSIGRDGGAITARGDRSAITFFMV